MRLKSLIFILALSLNSAICLSQTWFKVANENDTLVTTTAVTYRFGIATGTTNAGKVCPCWGPTVTTSGPITIPVVNGIADKTDANGDPAPGLAKELDIAETSLMQTVTVNGKAVQVPALPPPVIPLPQFTVTITAPTMNAPYVSSPPVLNGCITWGAQDKNGYQINGMACVNPPGSNTGVAK